MKNNTRVRNKRRAKKTNNMRGGVVLSEDKYNPSTFWEGLIPDAERKRIVIQLNYLGSARLCNEIQDVIPAFVNKPVEHPTLTVEPDGISYRFGENVYYPRSDAERKNIETSLQGHGEANWAERSKIMCATLLLLGIISSKLERANSPFIIVAKGGLGTALVVSQLQSLDTETVPVGDLDFKVIQKPEIVGGEYDPLAGKMLSLEICYLIRWFLKQTQTVSKKPSQVIGTGYDISILDLTEKKRVGYNEFIKVSLRALNGEKMPVLDMDFGEYSKNIQYFEGLSKISGSVHIGAGAQMPVSFIFQNNERMLAEKLLYYQQYLFLKNQLEDDKFTSNIKSHVEINLNRINDEAKMKSSPSSIPIVNYNFKGIGNLTYELLVPVGGFPEGQVPEGEFKFNGEKITVKLCDWFLQKFKRSIHILTNALMPADATDLLKSKRQVIEQLTPQISELGELGALLHSKVVVSVYPDSVTFATDTD